MRVRLQLKQGFLEDLLAAQERLQDESLLIRKIAVDSDACHPSPVGDFVEAGLANAPLGEQAQGREQDLFTSLVIG